MVTLTINGSSYSYPSLTTDTDWGDEAAAAMVALAGTAIYTTATQTMTNKTLTSPVINTPTITGGTISATLTMSGTAISTTNKIVDATLYDANSILAANSDNTPAALTVAASTVVGRAAAGNIDDLTMSALNTLLLAGGFGVPVGSIQAFAGATAPTGWLLCDGKTIGRDVGDTIFPNSSGSGAPDYYGTAYETLYGILSEAAARWETPAGTATWGTHKIYLPNLQDAFIRGEVGGASSIFTDSTKRSAGLGKKQDDALQEHSHPNGWLGAPNPNYLNVGAFPGYIYNAGAVTGARVANETVPKNVGVNYIIKYL